MILIKKIKGIIDTFQIETLRRELSIIERYSSKDGSADKYIDVVVLGQFKTGKSSLINSLIGQDILPVGIIPVTAIITRLQYATDEDVSVHFLDDACIKINRKQIENFIAESKNPKNIKNVKLVDLFIPQLSQFANIRIIDTPGIGSFLKHNSETAIQWLPEIGLALIVISIERPLAETDIQLLKNIKRYTSQIKIILTKTDLISLSQVEEVIGYIKNALVNEGLLDTKVNNLPIYPYSTLKNVIENRNQIIERIFVPLRENFAKNFENIFHHKMNAIIEACVSYLNIGLEISGKTETEREALKNAIIDEQLKLQIVKNELEIIALSYKNKNREFVASIVMIYADEIRTTLENEFQNEFDKWKGNLFKISGKFELWIENRLHEILYGFSEKAIVQLVDYVKNIQNHFSLFAASFAERLNRNVERVLGIELKTMILNMEIENIKQPDVSISYSFDIHIELLWFLFPMFLFKRFFKNFFQKKIPYEVEKNLSRLTSDISENISKVIERNRHLVAQYIYNELATIESLIKNQKQESGKFEQAIEEVKKLSESFNN